MRRPFRSTRRPRPFAASGGADMRGYTAISIAQAALTASGNGPAVDVSGFSGECRLVLSASATAGADNVLAVKVQHSANGTTGWEDSGVAFDEVTNAGAAFEEVGCSIDRFHRFIRVVDTLTGTTPTVVRAVTLFAKADRS